jgi:hypothetical protein
VVVEGTVESAIFCSAIVMVYASLTKPNIKSIFYIIINYIYTFIYINII